jgi:hypothetical protein
VAERRKPCSQGNRGDAAPLPFTALDHERRRIEAALHDGVQQDLAAVSVALQFAVQLLDSDAAAARALLDEAKEQVEQALERVRELSEDLYPSILAARGLTYALRGGTVGRYPLEVEEAVYFAVRPLLGTVRVWEAAGELRFEVTGIPDDDAAIAHARARIAAVGGQLEVSPGTLAGAVAVSPSAR